MRVAQPEALLHRGPQTRVSVLRAHGPSHHTAARVRTHMRTHHRCGRGVGAAASAARSRLHAAVWLLLLHGAARIAGPHHAARTVAVGVHLPRRGIGRAHWAGWFVTQLLLLWLQIWLLMLLSHHLERLGSIRTTAGGTTHRRSTTTAHLLLLHS